MKRLLIGIAIIVCASVASAQLARTTLHSSPSRLFPGIPAPIGPAAPSYIYNFPLVAQQIGAKPGFFATEAAADPNTLTHLYLDRDTGTLTDTKMPSIWTTDSGTPLPLGPAQGCVLANTWESLAKPDGVNPLYSARIESCNPSGTYLQTTNDSLSRGPFMLCGTVFGSAATNYDMLWTVGNNAAQGYRLNNGAGSGYDYTFAGGFFLYFYHGGLDGSWGYPANQFNAYAKLPESFCVGIDANGYVRYLTGDTETVSAARYGSPALGTVTRLAQGINGPWPSDVIELWARWGVWDLNKAKTYMHKAHPELWYEPSGTSIAYSDQNYVGYRLDADNYVYATSRASPGINGITAKTDRNNHLRRTDPFPTAPWTWSMTSSAAVTLAPYRPYTMPFGVSNPALWRWQSTTATQSNTQAAVSVPTFRSAVASIFIRSSPDIGPNPQSVYVSSAAPAPASCTCWLENGGPCTAAISGNLCYAYATPGTAQWQRLEARATWAADHASATLGYHAGQYGSSTGYGFFWGAQLEFNTPKATPYVRTDVQAVAINLPVEAIGFVSAATVDSSKPVCWAAYLSVPTILTVPNQVSQNILSAPSVGQYSPATLKAFGNLGSGAQVAWGGDANQHAWTFEWNTPGSATPSITTTWVDGASSMNAIGSGPISVGVGSLFGATSSYSAGEQKIQNIRYCNSLCADCP